VVQRVNLGAECPAGVRYTDLRRAYRKSPPVTMEALSDRTTWLHGEWVIPG
jgi:hypothetical protein